VKFSYQFSLNFEVQRQYAKVDPRMKSIRDAKMKFEAVSHYFSQLVQSPKIERSELEHTRFDALIDWDWEPKPEMTVACAVFPLKKELKSYGKEEADHTFGEEPLHNIDSRIR
jgi:hypothetical protein